MINKLYDYLGNIIAEASVFTPEMYGAKGDGLTDDSASIQSAINNKGVVAFGSGKTYKIVTTLRIEGDTILDLNGATILSTNKHLLFNFKNDSTATGYSGNGNITIRNGTIIGGAISFGHGENILLKNIHFKDSLNDHFLEIAGCKNYVVDSCSFVGMADVQTSVYEYINVDSVTYRGFPWLPSGSVFYDGEKNDGIFILNSCFALGESTYNYGYNAFGVHGVADQSKKHKNIRLVGNKVRDFTGCGFRLNDMEGIHVADNDIQVVGDGIRIGDVSNGNCEDIVIRHNYIVSSSGQKIVKTSGRYTGLTVSGNVTEGDTQEF